LYRAIRDQKTMKRKSAGKEERRQSPSELIHARIKELGDWRGKTLSRLRALIKKADPDAVEEWKWVKPTSPGVPVWSHHGLICTGEVYKDKVKMTFAKGASLEDPSRLFNSSLEGNTRRAIDFHEGDDFDDEALKALIRAAVTLNTSRVVKGKPAAAKPRGTAGEGKRSIAKSNGPLAAKPALLAGGNPQIAKADGDAAVQAYIAAMPDWKRDVGRRLDALVVRTVANVRKAVKWNSPFYGIEGQGWFLNVHCFTKYVKVAFFRGTSLRPLPPGASKHKEVRYLDIHEDDELDEALVASWIRQASELPGWVP
jgi:hypothetical protein